MPNLIELLAGAGLELIEANIGGGGSATVHKCRVTSSSGRLPSPSTLVAAKEYRADILKVPNQLQRIRQEADLGLQLDHPNVVRTFGLLGYDINSPTEDSPVVLLLEWIEGNNLEGWFRNAIKPIPWDAVRAIALDLVGGLGELHKNGIHHRDIKPENVMVRRENSAVLMDIGVAELTGSDETTLHTSVKDFVGSARYASPQFIMGTSSFAASDDIYSLGATLFLLLTGAPIFAEVERKSVIPIFVVTEQPKIAAIASEVPAPMKVLLQGMLHRDPTRRPTLEEVRESLENSDSAPYLTKELARQANDVRSYVVISVEQYNFFADLAGDTPELNETYTVVRPAKRQVTVASYNRQVTPEIWVAEATLKHVHQNIGHFAIHWKRWQHAPGSLSNLGISTGQWAYEEGSDLKVAVSDLVLRKKSK